ncbi:hypothetical protein ES703_15406 [subsurface metagenome]
MAKEEMICPFTGILCRECALYRGRHYYLCFSKKYRGHIEKSGEATRVSNPVTPELNRPKKIQIPAKMPSAVDPFKRPLADIRE